MIHTSVRGDVLYNAELDTHLVHLTVGETLSFASRARLSRHVPGGLTRQQFDLVNRDVIMVVFGLTHTVDTRVGDDFVRGVSGGERKRVSIAEAALTGTKFQCWDNSTRGLDSANAINFCRNLRRQVDLLDLSSTATLYQALQAAYDLFARVSVIYEDRQILFGRGTAANILVKLFWGTLLAVVIYFCWYYPVGFVRNTTSDDQTIRGFLVFLFVWVYLLFASSLAHLAITWIELPETAGVLVSLLWMLCILFCGIGVPRDDLPRFWIFMYRASPATYLVGGIMSTAVATTNGFLAGFDLDYGNRWRDFGLLWVYIVFNVAVALRLYWVFRVPKGQGLRKKV